MFNVISCIWFTSGQEMLDITTDNLQDFKSKFMLIHELGFQSQHVFGWSWVQHAMQQHDPCEFFWTTKGSFETLEEAQALKAKLQSTIQFPFAHKPNFIDDTKGLVF